MNKILTVSQLNNYVKNVFDDELLLQNITVEGEVFEVKFSGGNSYITLKEGEYILPCVKFGSRYEFDAGDKIHVTGSMRFYPRGGKTTFVVTNAMSVGKGELLMKFGELKDKLKKEGIFDNGKPMPRFVRKIALITSTEGAVIHDFLEVLTRNDCGYIDVDVYGVKVQGTGAEDTIAKALYAASLKAYDVVVVARGGGSGQDLSCFNSEVVARSVFNCAYPVISAVGHEVDYTLSDFASTLRAGTPSIAAEKVVRINESLINEFHEKLDFLRTKAEGMLSGAMNCAKGRLTNLMLTCERKTADLNAKSINMLGLMRNACRDKITTKTRSIETKIAELSRGAQFKIDECSHELRFVSALLDKTDPKKILSKGYAKVIRDGVNMDNVSGISVGDKLKVIMYDGTLKVTVDEKTISDNQYR